MSLRITPAGTALVRGVQLDEVGVQIRSFDVKFSPQFSDRFQNMFGVNSLRAVTGLFSRQIICEGEIWLDNAGVLLFTLGSSISFTNSVISYGGTILNAGSILLDEATITMSRTGWRSVSIKASSDPFI